MHVDSVGMIIASSAVAAAALLLVAAAVAVSFRMLDRATGTDRKVLEERARLLDELEAGLIRMEDRLDALEVLVLERDRHARGSGRRRNST